MTGIGASVGNSLGGSGASSTGDGPRHPQPWKFGAGPGAMIADRGDI